MLGPRSIGEGKQEGGDAERDDDRRQHEGLLEGVRVGAGLALEQRGRSRRTARTQENEVGGVRDQSESDDDATQEPLKDEVGAGAEEDSGREGDGPVIGSDPSLKMAVVTSPTTTM